MDKPEYRQPAIGLTPEEKVKPSVAKLPELPHTSDIRELAQAVESDIFSTYYDLMMDDEAPAAVRKAAADALADRARGKPAGEAPHLNVQINNAIPEPEVLRRLQFLLYQNNATNQQETETIDQEKEPHHETVPDAEQPE